MDDDRTETGSLTFKIKYDDLANHTFMGTEANFYGTTGTANGISLYYALSTANCDQVLDTNLTCTAI